MASLTVRQLDDKLKRLLRLRAARHGRSMEDEIRIILRDAADETGREALDLINPPNPQPPAERPRRAVPQVKRVLLIIGGGIAAYKSLDLIRRLSERQLAVRCILTKAAEQFVTPLAAGALAGERVLTDLFDPATEFDVGHIRLAREADLIIVAPATADLMAKMAGGQANDLATAVLLATGARVLLAPAMNPHMWANKATQRNVAQLKADGFTFIGPNEGEMAETGERGLGRMAEPLEIAAAAERLLAGDADQPLKGLRMLVTSGPTHEPIDPVRYIANRSSGKQGHAIAAAAARAGADVTLISGPVSVADPSRCQSRESRNGARNADGRRAQFARGYCDFRRRGRRLARRHMQARKRSRSKPAKLRRSWRWSKIRTFSPPSHIGRRAARILSSALPRKRRMSSRTRKTN